MIADLVQSLFRWHFLSLKIEVDCRLGAIAVELALREPKHQETAAYCNLERELYVAMTAAEVETEMKVMKVIHSNLVESTQISLKPINSCQDLTF